MTFEEALELDADERVAFIERQLAATPKALSRALRLLRFHSADAQALEPPQGVWRPSLENPPTPGESLAGYSLIGLLGEGGMGIVYEAEQASPHRRVALKVLRPLQASQDTKREAKSRQFLNESNVLGTLTHPQIAQVFEAGSADDLLGRPTQYIAMELVDGARDIVRYAEEEGLSVEQRIAMLRDVCAGVAYGHSKGVVHRDLKPVNVLVDQAGTVKVIDFGIAHVMDEESLLTVFTDDNQRVVGTLAYMAPEQLAGGSSADARIDVYALGVLAYELFAGRRPFQGEKDPAGGTVTAHVGEVQRILQAGRPVPASTFGEGVPADLDWVIDRALESDPDRRYEDAAALGAEFDALLKRRPVQAGPPSRMYAVKRFVQRHRALVLVNTLLLLSLLAGFTGALVWWRQEARQVDSLIQEVHRTGAVIEFWELAFGEFSLHQKKGGKASRRALDDAFEQWRNESQPANARLLGLVLLARAQESLGHIEEARTTIQVAIDEGAESLGSAQREVQIARAILANLHYQLGSTEAAKEQIEILLAQERADLLVADSFTLKVAEEFAGLLGSLGRLDEAEDTFRWVCAQSERLHRDKPRLTVAANHRWAKEILSWGAAGRAVEIIDNEVAAAASAAGRSSLPVPATRTRAWALSTLGKHSEAIEQQEAALAALLSRKEAVPGHISSLEAELGWLLVHDQRLEHAEGIFRRVIARKLNVDAEPEELEHLHLELLRRARDLPNAPREGREALAPVPVGAKIGLAFCLVLRGELDEAQELLREVRSAAVSLIPAHHPDRAVLHGTLGRLAALKGNAAKAAREFRRAEEVLELRTDDHFYQFQVIVGWNQELAEGVEEGR